MNRSTLFAIGLSIAFGLTARADFFSWIEEEGTARTHPAIQEALSSSQIQSDRAYTNHTELKQLCSKNSGAPTYGDAPVNYWITRKNGALVIDLPIMVTYHFSPEERESALYRIPVIERCVEDFYRKNGLDLNLTFTEGDPQGAQAYGYSYVDLWASYDRDNAQNWAVLSDQHGAMSTRQACALWVHETGHLLGLPDRYADPACPDRTEVESSRNEIMAHVGADPYEQTLSDDDVAIILKPLLTD